MGMFDSVSNMFRRKKNDNEQFGGEMNFANEQAVMVQNQAYSNQTEDDQQWHDIIQEYEIFKENYFKNPVDDPSTPDKIFIRDISELEGKITEHIPKKVVEDEIVIKRIVEEDAFVKPLDFEAVREAPAQTDYANKMFEPAVGEALGMPGVFEESSNVESHKVRKGNLDKEAVIMFNQAQQDEFFNDFGNFSGEDNAEEIEKSAADGTGFDDALLDYLFGENDSAKADAEKDKEKDSDVKNRVFVFSDNANKEAGAKESEVKKEKSKDNTAHKNKKEDSEAFLEYFQNLAGSGGSNIEAANFGDSSKKQKNDPVDDTGGAKATEGKENTKETEKAEDALTEESPSEFADFFSDLMQSAVIDKAGTGADSDRGEGGEVTADSDGENFINRVFLQRGIDGDSDVQQEESVRDTEKRSVVEKEVEGENSVVFSEVFTDAVKKAESDIVKDETAVEQIEEVVVKKKEVKQNRPSNQGESKSSASKQTVEIEVDDPFSAMMNSMINALENNNDVESNHEINSGNEASEFFVLGESDQEDTQESKVEKRKNETISIETVEEIAQKKAPNPDKDFQPNQPAEVKGEASNAPVDSPSEESEKSAGIKELEITEGEEAMAGKEVVVNHHYPRPVPVIVKQEVPAPFEKIVEVPESKNNPADTFSAGNSTDISDVSASSAPAYINEEEGWMPLSQTEVLGIKADDPALVGDLSKYDNESNVADLPEKEEPAEGNRVEIQQTEVTVIKEAVLAEDGEAPAKKKRRRRRRRKKSTVTPEIIGANVLGVTEDDSSIKIADSEAGDTADKVQIQKLEEVALPGESLEIHQFEETQTKFEAEKPSGLAEDYSGLAEQPELTVQELLGENFNFDNLTENEESVHENLEESDFQVSVEAFTHGVSEKQSREAPFTQPTEFANADFFTPLDNSPQATEPSPFDIIYDTQKLTPQAPMPVETPSKKENFFARLLAKIKEILFKERGKKKPQAAPVLLDEEKIDVTANAEDSLDITEGAETLQPQPRQAAEFDAQDGVLDNARRINIKGIVLGGVSGYDVVLENGSVVKNNISADHLCFCSPDAVINGNVEGAMVVINGVVRGNIFASVSLEIKAGAMVFGDVTTPSLTIDESAMIQGNVSKFESKAESLF